MMSILKVDTRQCWTALVHLYSRLMSPHISRTRGSIFHCRYALIKAESHDPDHEPNGVRSSRLRSTRDVTDIYRHFYDSASCGRDTTEIRSDWKRCSALANRHVCLHHPTCLVVVHLKAPERNQKLLQVVFFYAGWACQQDLYMPDIAWAMRFKISVW